MTTPPDQPPAWVADAVFYQIFPDRFARSGRTPQPGNLEEWNAAPTVHGYKGGDLEGIIDRLDWLTDLGVNAIYLNPIFQSAANHRYHTHDYYRIDPLLGDDAAFDRLVAACKARSMRIVLDGVFNHASRGFFQFNDLLESGERSPWRDWFTVQSFPVNAYDEHNPPNYHAWWGLPALPKFNTENPDVREFLMRVGEHWMRRGVDGWRLDVPLEIQTEGFWEEFRARVRSANPDAYIVAEIWTEATDWISHGDRFDGVMNYLLTGAVVSFAGVGRVNWQLADALDYDVRDIDAAGYRAAIDHLLSIYPDRASRANLNLLGSHDTARLRSVVGGHADAVVLAMLLTMTFPGAPCVYYGDEIGLEGGHDPACRAGFPWTSEDSWNTEILQATRSLIQLRHDEPTLRHGEYRSLTGAAGSLLYAFERTLRDTRIVVAANAGGDPSGFEIPVQEDADAVRLWGETELVVANGAATATVPGRSGGIWRLG